MRGSSGRGGKSAPPRGGRAYHRRVPDTTTPPVVGPFTGAEIAPISAAFTALGWPGKTPDLYEGYLAEQRTGAREALVVRLGGELAGYVTVVWRSDYAPFREAGIPEIADLNVLPHLRRRGAGGALMDAAEALIAARGDTAGLGVGLYADYAAAMRMYLRRGYLPDGRGVAYDYLPVPPGRRVRVDDALTLMMTRRLTGAPA
jgi:GNAT superfamily N-acetyltransferase